MRRERNVLEYGRGASGPAGKWHHNILSGTGYKSKYYINRPRILTPRQIEVQRKVEVEGGGGKSAKPVT